MKGSLCAWMQKWPWAWPPPLEQCPVFLGVMEALHSKSNGLRTWFNLDLLSDVKNRSIMTMMSAGKQTIPTHRC